MSNKHIGMDLWQVRVSKQHLYRVVKQKDWCLYELTTKHDEMLFYAPISLRKEIAHTFEHAKLIKTSGMLGFLFRQMRKPCRIIALLCAIVLWYLLSHTIFTITIHGDNETSKQLILTTLTDLGYTTPFYEHDMQQLKSDLKKQLENEIAWLEIVKIGSQYQIQFTTKEFATIEPLKQDELIAQKDGVIEHFELQHGNKLVAINDFVHAGDVLVSHVLIDSDQMERDLYVKGKVYAYTWKDVHVEMPANSLPKAFQFYQLLFEARNEASKDLRQGESIYKENILQFQDNTGTISIDIHYTLIEDITTPK